MFADIVSTYTDGIGENLSSSQMSGDWSLEHKKSESRDTDINNAGAEMSRSRSVVGRVNRD